MQLGVEAPVGVTVLHTDSASNSCVYLDVLVQPFQALLHVFTIKIQRNLRLIPRQHVNLHDVNTMQNPCTRTYMDPLLSYVLQNHIQPVLLIQSLRSAIAVNQLLN